MLLLKRARQQTTVWAWPDGYACGTLSGNSAPAGDSASDKLFLWVRRSVMR
jgi:hypothetical protein